MEILKLADRLDKIAMGLPEVNSVVTKLVQAIQQAKNDPNKKKEALTAINELKNQLRQMKAEALSSSASIATAADQNLGLAQRIEGLVPNLFKKEEKRNAFVEIGKLIEQLEANLSRPSSLSERIKQPK